MAHTLLKPDRCKKIEDIVNNILINDVPFDQWKIVQTIAQKENVKIEQADLKDLSGTLSKDNTGTWRIVVNKDDSVTRKLFTIAHEFGHYYLHRDEQDTFIDGEFSTCYQRTESTKFQEHELEANEFAASLIMPKSVLEKEIARLKAEKGVEIIDSNFVTALAQFFKVSSVAMVTRLKNLDYVS